MTAALDQAPASPQGPQLAVSAITDPLDPKSWSGTPANVCDAIRRRGRLGCAVSGMPHGSVPMRLRAIASWAARGGRVPIRQMALAPLSRRAQAAHIQTELARCGARHVLHFAADRYLPLTRIEPGVFHYLLLDGTWDTWRKNWKEGEALTAGYIAEREAAAAAAYRQMSHLFTLGEYARDNLISHYGIPADRVTVVGSGRGVIEPFNGPKDYSNGAILFAARNRWVDKGGDLVVAAFKLAHARNSKLQLWIVGDDSVKHLANELPATTVHGYLSLEQLQDLFNRASLFAMPSLQEPWGLVYLEALACKTPILGLAVNAIPEFTGKGRYGFMVEQPTAEAVADAMVRAFADPSALERMGSEGQAFCLANYSWDKLAGSILDVVDRNEAVRQGSAGKQS